MILKCLEKRPQTDVMTWKIKSLSSTYQISNTDDKQMAEIAKLDGQNGWLTECLSVSHSLLVYQPKEVYDGILLQLWLAKGNEYEENNFKIISNLFWDYYKASWVTIIFLCFKNNLQLYFKALLMIDRF